MKARSDSTAPTARSRGKRWKLVVGIVNNMSDGALRSTETQFCSVIREAAPPGLDVDFRYFSLREIRRSGETRGYMEGRYKPTDQLEREGVDALLVTGAEPRGATFEDETYWPSLAQLVDWAMAQQVPTIWSCLAAHAALWRMYRIPRTRVPQKHSGIFPLELGGGYIGRSDPSITPVAPHSRWNGLDRVEIEAAGFEIIASSPVIGVDTFVRAVGAMSLFFQGHPEYDADTLSREYLRDVSRFMRGQGASLPRPPLNYFDQKTLKMLAELTERAERKPDPSLLAEYARVIGRQRPSAIWRPWALHLYRAWLAQFGGEPTCERLARKYVAG